MTKDALGTIFRVEKRLGRGDLFELISHFRDGTKKTTVYQHEDYDGMGALLNESEQWSGAKINLPLFNLKTELKLKHMFSGLLGLKSDCTPSVAQWKKLDAKATYTPEHLAWRVFSPEDTQKLIAAARERKISLNTLVLACASRVISQELLMPEQNELRWLVPVNMRRSDSERISKKNHTSSVGLNFSRNATLTEIDHVYRNALNGWRALSNHSLAKAAASLGEQILYKLAKKRGETNYWIGSFTNLGVWNFPIDDESARWPYALSITPPAGTPCFPVGIGIITWQKHFSISLRLHAGLMDTEHPRMQEAVMDKIIELLSEYLNATLLPKDSSLSR